ncbi:MAG: hypothetical protein SGJ27_15320 [Candidatus Melainabacteria bacterium]|nr:hypothetical protein [Candidatus Melainabacteria bacterium]
MLTKDVLADGSTRLKAGSCAFLFRRLAVGVVYTAVQGTDTGALGTAPLEELTAEFNRFKRPVTWFVDADNAPGVVSSVLEQWTAWFLSHRNLFERIHVLTNSKHMNLTMEVAKHLSNMQRLMITYDDRVAFDQAMQKSYGGSHKADSSWCDEDSKPISKSLEKDGTISISNENSSFTFKRLNELALWSTICGVENGSLSNVPFDHVDTELSSASKKLTWYVDCSNVTRLDQNVLESWTEWAHAHADKLDSLHMYVPSGAIPILIDIAMSKTNTHKLIHLYRDKESFNKVCSRNSVECLVP